MLMVDWVLIITGAAVGGLMTLLLVRLGVIR